MPAYDARHLLDHGGSRTEYVGRPTVRDVDVRQDATVRLVKTYRRQGTPLPAAAEELMSTLNTQPRYISQSLKSSVIDAQRKRKRAPLPLTAAAHVADPTAEAAFAAVEASPADEIDAFLSTATPAEREALDLMRIAQNFVSNRQPLPDSVRSRLKRLRRETGLALDVSLL